MQLMTYLTLSITRSKGTALEIHDTSVIKYNDKRNLKFTRLA